MECILCEARIYNEENGDPYLSFMGKSICTSCAIDMIEPIYRIYGTGGIQHLAFTDCLKSGYNRKKRQSIRNYKSVLKKLLHKYNFKCVHCQTKENLTIDHKIPVSKGGSDNIRNLQILCKSCNSKKGAKL